MLKFEDYRQHVEEIFLAALAAVEPGNAVRRFLKRQGPQLHVGDVNFDLDRGRVFIVSVGKAAVPMAEAALDLLGEAVYSGGVIAKRGSLDAASDALKAQSGLQLMEGSHPISGPDSVEATAEVIAQLDKTTENDLVLCLISGGASALLTQPVLSLSDWQLLVDALLTSGCTINELNTVRRQLDRVKGGGLAQFAAPAQCASLILSDVVGNPLEAIGSGPTVILTESPSDAVRVLARYEVAEAIGAPAYKRILDALRQQDDRKTTAPIAGEIIIVGDVKRAAGAAEQRAQELGFTTQILTVHLEGEAREVGRVAVAIAKDSAPGLCFICGGETTVTLRGDGQGGRNQETALAAAIALDNWPLVAIASLATDGEDGPTPAAGAIVAGWTAPEALGHGLSPQAYLDRNDSFTFFSKLDEITGATTAWDGFPPCLVVPGSTGTNVNDLLLVLTYEGTGR